MALNVNFNVLLTTMATGMYRLFPRQLRGFERAQLRQIWRRFPKSPRHIRVTADQGWVKLRRRAHSPILVSAGLLEERTQVP